MPNRASLGVKHRTAYFLATMAALTVQFLSMHPAMNRSIHHPWWHLCHIFDDRIESIPSRPIWYMACY